MKTILSLRRHRYLRTVGSLLIAIVLIAAVASCTPTPVVEYDLTMAASPAAGGTATDETDTSPYAEGTEVDIKAVANTGYEFAGWTAPAGEFDDEDAAETTFAMPAQDVTVTANFAPVYDLTMAANPAAGGTATDETGTSPYPAGTGVDIKAIANPPYQFFKWTAPAGAFGDENAATTTFTMPAEDVTATANFVGPLDHGTMYEVDWETAPYIEEEVCLEDQFGAFDVVVGSAVGFANPASKVHGDVTTTIYNPDHHLVAYEIMCEEEPQYYQVTVSNQFGEGQELIVWGPMALAVPTQKEGHEAPLGLDHYLLYEVLDGPNVYEYVSLTDQFGEQPEALVGFPIAFANPVKKTHGDEVTEILHPDVHGVIYYTEGEPIDPRTVQVMNQFGEQALDVAGPYGLIVPSQKIAWEWLPMFDHFRSYKIDPGTEPYIGEIVQLQDQFLAAPLDALVEWGMGFCNPAGKYHADFESPIWHWEYHLMVYSLDYEAPAQVYEVTVDNQFGEGQVLYVYGPVALAVPTHKLWPDDYGPPEGLDHFLLYLVIDYTIVPDVPVELWDQFNWEPEVWVYDPVYFANPVQKTHGEVTEIENPEWHMVFYNAPGAPLDPPQYVETFNQFGPHGFTVTWPDSLGVPSQKIAWVPLGPA